MVLVVMFLATMDHVFLTIMGTPAISVFATLVSLVQNVIHVSKAIIILSDTTLSTHFSYWNFNYLNYLYLFS